MEAAAAKAAKNAELAAKGVARAEERTERAKVAKLALDEEAKEDLHGLFDKYALKGKLHKPRPPSRHDTKSTQKNATK